MKENDRMRKITILLTACIHPNTKEGLAVSDAELRKQQYLNAINWYLKHTPYRIVFCENSGTDVSRDVWDPDHRVEFITYVSGPMMVDYGKGLRELEIIEYAIAHSAFLMKSDIIIKGTGRLILKNMVPVVSWLVRKNTNDFCSIWMSLKMWMCDSRFFFCSPSFLLTFVGYKNRLNYKINFERLLATCISENRDKFSFLYPNLWYNIEGIGGGIGVIYHFTRVQYYSKNIKNIVFYIAYNWLRYWPKKKYFNK